MHSKTRRWLIPAAAAAAVVAFVGLRPSGKGNGVVLAEVVQHLQSAHTVTCRVAFYAKAQLLGTADYMSLGDRLTRAATNDGMVFIADGAAGRALVLDPRSKRATYLTVLPHRFDFHKFLTELTKSEGATLGTKQIDGREAIGFQLHRNDAVSSIWIDTQSRLPVQIEVKSTDESGESLIISGFVLDAPLDESLFRIALPEGYVEGPIEWSELTRRLAGERPNEDSQTKPRAYESAADRSTEYDRRARAGMAARRIVTACLRYAADQGGQWPDNLQSLASYGIDAAALVNPRRPEDAIGWVYRKPAASRGQIRNAATTAVIHEPLEPWNDGVSVGFADGHTEFIKDRKRVEKLLGQ
jgi:hypothetical protein